MERNSFQEISTPHGTMSVYVSYPEIENLRKGIVVLQEAFGVNSHIRDVCQRLSELGYVALAPELFHRQGKHLTIPYEERKKIMPLLEQTTNDQLSIDVRAAVDFAREEIGLEVSVLGFCMGGFAAVLAALRCEVRSAISFYGAGLLGSRAGVGFGALGEELPGLRCPLLLIYGEEDPSIPIEERHLLSTILQEYHKIYEIEVYAGCNHGFFCDERKSYVPSAAQAAWKRSLHWLEAYA